jgi:hypothetical protein
MSSGLEAGLKLQGRESAVGGQHCLRCGEGVTLLGEPGKLAEPY